MSDLPHGSYLETDVLTATPQKLRLMLIDAAIRATQRTRHYWDAGDLPSGSQSLIHAQNLATELLASLNREATPELAAKLAAVYVFVVRCLIEAGLEQNKQKLDDAIRVLEEERQTWQQVCQQTARTSSVGDQHAVPQTAGGTTAKPVPIPHLVRGANSQDQAACRLSLEA